MLSLGGGCSPGGQVLSGMEVLLGGGAVHNRKRGSDIITPPLPHVDRQTGVKTLPCPNFV